MDPVMVPVPEELEERVRQYLTARMGMAGSAGWSEESVAAVYQQLDDPARIVLAAIAQGAVDGQPITVATAAEAAATSTRAVLGIVLELFQRFKNLGGPNFPIMLVDPAEGAAADQQLLAMPGDGARLVLAVAART